MLASDGPRRNNHFFPAERFYIVPIQSLIAAGQDCRPQTRRTKPQGPDPMDQT